VVVLTAALFSIGGFINAIFAKKFDDISIVPTFVLTPLTYLGGVFYSIDLLPEPWRTLSLCNPVLYMVNAFRYGILGVSDINLGTAFVVITAFTAGFFCFALYLLEHGVGLRA
jgi:ABC-2 type transport system permease protein